MPVQVLGELQKAMEDIARFNQIVWDEVTQTCEEESVRISNSFRGRTGARHAPNAEAQGLPDPDGFQVGPAIQQSSDGQNGRAGCQSTAEAGMEVWPAEQAGDRLDSSILQARTGAVAHADHARHGGKVQHTTDSKSCRVTQSCGSQCGSEHSPAGSSTSQRQRPADPRPESQIDGKTAAKQRPQGKFKTRLVDLFDNLPD